MNTLEEIQNWYKMNCDGDWEHTYGVTIETLDNPGWAVKIELTDTLLEDMEFKAIENGDSEIMLSVIGDGVYNDNVWIKCYKEDSVWTGMGSPDKLEEILKVFLKWEKEQTDTSPWDEEVQKIENEIKNTDNVCDKIPYLRKIFWELIDIPNEHPRKREILTLLNKYWNRVIKDVPEDKLN